MSSSPPQYPEVIGALLFTYFHLDRSAIDDPGVLKSLGLSCAPSETNTPVGWKDDEARAIGKLRVYMRPNSYEENVHFLQSGSGCVAGRLAWTEVFQREIGPRVNKFVHNLMFKAGRHPIQLMEAQNTHDLPDFTAVRSDDIEEQVADFFGPVTRHSAAFLLDGPAPASQIVDFVLEGFRKAHGKAVGRLQKVEEDLERAMERKPPGQTLRFDLANYFTLAIVEDGRVTLEEAGNAIKALSDFMKVARWLPLCGPKAYKYNERLTTKFDSKLVGDIDGRTLENWVEEASDEESGRLVEITPNYFELVDL
ncbi:hypothetical protein BDN72DRAFT_863624 [Pluteus cervinus]|uniref:Uncharacterized protein n=1 Tax=Pluteus cervinus TaxID=181527 RepID=A0ACD3A6Y3_9AGAR|nr:hypothetical protein BDN72DRAFT_863624 [Pluteus cervinus]